MGEETDLVALADELLRDLDELANFVRHGGGEDCEGTWRCVLAKVAEFPRQEFPASTRLSRSVAFSFFRPACLSLLEQVAHECSYPGHCSEPAAGLCPAAALAYIQATHQMHLHRLPAP